MADWATFLGFAGVVLTLLLLLARASQSTVQRRDEPQRDESRRDEPTGSGASDRPTRPRGDSDEDPDEDPRVGPRRRDAGSFDSTARSDSSMAGDDDPSGAPPAGDSSRTDPADPSRSNSADRSRTDPADPSRTTRDAGGEAPLAIESDDGRGAKLDLRGEDEGISTVGLLANVAVSQGAFGVLLVAGAWLTGVPAAAFGLGPTSLGVVWAAVGAGLGVALYAANEVGAAIGDRVGLGRPDELRTALAPDSPAGWAILLFVVLPMIAGFEELLFRGTLVGAVAMGTNVSPWLMAAVSSVAFAVGHGAQGPAGVIVTGVLGFVLAAAFVLTGSLLVVIVAHYLVNALEFAVHEGFEIEWFARAGG